MGPSPDELHYFLELCHTLNFSRASERIGISQPSLSAAIKRLEESVGIELFARNKKKVTLTPAGKRLFSHTKQLLQLWETVKSESLASHHEAIGRVTLGCHAALGSYLLPQCLSHLLSEYPQLEIQLKHDISRKITEEVINLSIDIGIVVNPIKHPDLIIHPLYTDEVFFWCSTSAKHTHPHSFLEKAIICQPELIQTQWLLKQLHKKEIKYSRVLTSSSLEVIAALTANDCGIGILPKSITSSLYPGKLQPILETLSYRDEICLIYRPENREIKVVQILVSALKNYCKQISNHSPS